MGKLLVSFLSSDNHITMITRDTFSTTRWEDFNVICLAIKPQDFQLITTLPLSHTLIISVMTGITTETLMKITHSAAVIRTMPNTPIKIGLGVTAWCKTKAVTQADSQWFQNAFSKVSKLIDVENDDGINKATAISGCGPAYVFAFAEALMSAARELGFSEEQAQLLVTQTCVGATALLEQATVPVAELRQQVTSKGGTTAAALNALELSGFETMWNQAIQAAYDKAKTLSSQTR